MRFLLDHDVPDDAAFSLVALGHEVVKLREVLPMTTPDDEVLRLAGDRDCLLITCNRDDFLDAATRVDHHGIIILHPSQVSRTGTSGVGAAFGLRRRIGFAR